MRSAQLWKDGPGAAYSLGIIVRASVHHAGLLLSESIARAARTRTRSLRGGPRDDIGSLIGQISEKNALLRPRTLCAPDHPARQSARRSTIGVQLASSSSCSSPTTRSSKARKSISFFFRVDKRGIIRERREEYLRLGLANLKVSIRLLFAKNIWKVNGAVRWIESRILFIVVFEILLPKTQYFVFLLSSVSSILLPYLMAVRWLIDKLRRVKISRNRMGMLFLSANSWKFESSRGSQISQSDTSLRLLSSINSNQLATILRRRRRVYTGSSASN